MEPDSYVVEEVEFSSDAPTFGGIMKIKTMIEEVPEDALVTLICTQ